MRMSKSGLVLAIALVSAVVAVAGNAGTTANERKGGTGGGDGVCDNYVDANGDGVCDNLGTGTGTCNNAQKGGNRQRTRSLECEDGGQWIDEDGDGICDNCDALREAHTRTRGGGNGPKAGDGTCDGSQDRDRIRLHDSSGSAFVDANGDGICDNSNAAAGDGACDGTGGQCKRRTRNADK